MFCSRKSKLRLKTIHKKTIRVVYNEYEKNYKNLLVDHDEFSIHQSIYSLYQLESSNRLIN